MSPTESSPRPSDRAAIVQRITALGALAVVRYFGPGAHFYRPALTGGVLLFGLYLVPWLLLLRHQNRYTAQPATLLAAAFAFAGAAVGAVGISNREARGELAPDVSEQAAAPAET